VKTKRKSFSWTEITQAIAEKPLLLGIRQGFMYMVPLLIIGAVIVAVLNIPIDSFQNFMLDTFGEGWKTFPLIVHGAVMQVISLSAVLCIGYSIACGEKLVEDGIIRTVYPVLTAFVSYIAFQPLGEVADAAVSARAAGASSMFTATVIAILSVKLFLFFYKKYDAAFPEHAYTYNGNSTLRQSFHMIPPILVTVLIFSGANMVMHYTGASDWIRAWFADAFHDLFFNNDLPSVILIVLITQLLWFFGIHGGNAFLEAYANAQQEAEAGGAALSAYPKEFFDIFVYYGGAGTTLALVIVLLFFGMKRSSRSLAKGALFPSLLNINEPLVFGLPIVLNPYFLIPFLAAPVAAACIAYFALNAGLVPFPSASVAWTTPIFVSGYISTGSKAAILLQLVCLLVAVVIYMPFVSIARQAAESRYREDFRLMEGQMSYLQSLQMPKVLNRSDEAGGVARFLAREIAGAISYPQKADGLHIEYQPKSAVDGRVLGAEALLRWVHPDFGYIAPTTVLGIADEAGLSNRLGRWVIRQALTDMERWRRAGYEDLSLAVNLSPTQLNTDGRLGDFIGEALQSLGIPPGMLEFELTENATIEKTDRLHGTLKKIRERGSDISIDDFGMGHSSLKYIFDFCANVVKLDTSLVQGLTEGEDRRIIVRAILDLCKRLGVRVIAEGVETEQQLAIAAELGAEAFQGWYFSKAMKYNDFLEYVDSHREGEKP
jgi:lactose/cellobiose-specific phosphotransferase system IIC component